MKTITDFTLLSKNGMNAAPHLLAHNAKDAVAAARKIGYPVALKILSEDISHKSDRGAVMLNLLNDAEVVSAYEKILLNCKGAKVAGMLVQKMSKPGIEVIIGGKRDPQFGQLIMFGMGGIFVEVYRDVAWRVCPIDASEAAKMIREVKGYRVLAGARGKPPINEAALIDLLAKVSRLLLKHDPLELDLNPVIVQKDGYEIVDMRMAVEK